MKYLFTLSLLIFSLFSFAQINEVEPNNSVNDVSVVEIDVIETYQGDAASDDDFWTIKDGSKKLDYTLTGNAELITYSDAGRTITESTSVLAASANLTLNDSKYYAIRFHTSAYTFTLNSALPVELTYFKASAENETIQLTWQTASEENNEGFEVQRSEDAGNWDVIGFVLGQGTTHETQDYVYNDDGVENNNTYYYRLKQIDFDGQFEYSNVIAIIASNSEYKVYPTFTKDVLNVSQETLIFDSIGRLRTQGSGTINVSELENGIYYAKNQLQGTVIKFVIAK